MPYFEDIKPELDAAAFDPATDIKETFELSGTQPGGGDTFGLENAEATLVFLIDWRKARAFTRWMLGFAYADGEYPFRLHRENPQYHPRFLRLTASTIHFSSIAPKANDEGTGTPELNSPNYPAVFVLPNAVNKTAYYDSVFATVRYVRKDYDFRPDSYVADDGAEADPADELDRNAIVTPSPLVELLTAEGGKSQVKWSEGGGGLEPLVDTVVSNSFAIRVSKVRLLLEWYSIPEQYLSNDPAMFFPEKLFSVIGKVNSVPLLGRPAGTLLCDAPKMQRFQYPVSTFDGIGGFFGWNLTIPLTYWNPTLGVPDTSEGVDDDKARGHRCLPHAASTKFWGAKREDTSDPLAQWLLEEADLNVMLEHIGK